MRIEKKQNIIQNQDLIDKEWIASGLEQSLLPNNVIISEISPDSDLTVQFPNGAHMIVKHLGDPHWWCEITMPNEPAFKTIKIRNLDDLVDRIEEYSEKI